MGDTHYGGVVASEGFKIGNKDSKTAVMDSSRNMSNIGTISSGAITSSGAIIGLAPVTASITGNTTLTAAQSGTVFLVGTDAATVTLPATAAGVMYTFIVNNTTAAVTISPNSSDMIQGKMILGATSTTLALAGEDANSIGMTTTNVAIGDRVSIVGDGGAGWLVVEGLGLGLAEVT